MALNIKKIQTKKFLWLDIINATQEDLKYIKQEFNLNTEDINDCLPIMQRQKVHRRQGYVFMVIQMPLYNRETGILEASEIDLFISKKYLITI